MKQKTGICVAAILVLVICTFIFSIVSDAAAAEKYPSRPVTMIVPFAAGGMSSQCTQMWKPFMEKYLPGTVIVDHKPGGGTVIGNTFVATSKPDGYTLLTSSDWFPAIVSGTATYKLEDLVPVAQVAKNGTVLTVSADAPWKTFQEFMDYARKNPGGYPLVHDREHPADKGLGRDDRGEHRKHEKGPQNRKRHRWTYHGFASSDIHTLIF